MDSSVIFLVVLGLWAAYLVPHWLRRREDLSASRSVDRFSEAMRVLSRRPVPRARPEHLRTSAYVLAPAREVAALTAGTPTRSRPDVAVEVRVEVEPDEDVAPAPSVPAVPSVLPVLSGRRPRLVVARVLAALLLLSLVAVPVLGVLSVAGLLPAWAAAPAAGVVVLLVVALRACARRRRRAARTSVPPGAVTVVGRPQGAEHGEVADATAPREELYDVQAHADGEEQERIRRLAEEALRAADVPYREPEPGEWTPVAVPLPAYLLKPHARPAWQPVPAPSGSARARVADVDEDDIPTYAPPARRVAGA